LALEVEMTSSIETRRESGAWKAKHARILSAALDEFIAKGFAGASMDRIAQKAKVSKVTIYNHFENKDLLYRQMVEHFLANVHPGLPIISTQAGSTPRDVLIDYGVRLVDVTGHPRTLGMIRLLRAEPMQLTSDHRAESRLLPDAKPLAKFLEDEHRKGSLLCPVPILASRQLHGMWLEATIYPSLLGHNVDLASGPVRQTVASCVEVFLKHYMTA
jgi:TetR/AcrR family transcriptional regulator, regulator of autoinduction and epiphytic fitness